MDGDVRSKLTQGKISPIWGMFLGEFCERILQSPPAFLLSATGI